MKKIKWNILLIIIIFTLSGCKTTKNQTVKIEKKDRAPKSLGSISKGLQDILNGTEKIESILNGTDYEVEKAQLEKAKEEEKAKSERIIEVKNETKGETQSGSESQGAKGKEEIKPQDKDEKLLKTWEDIDKKIEQAHEEWNKYEVEGVKKGIATDKMEKFKDSLNALTKSIEDKRVLGIYDYGSQSMSNLAPMFEAYKDEIGGEINKIKYSAYQSYLKALEGKDTEAADMLKDLDNETNKIRLKLDKNDSRIKILDNINLSISDMKKALKEKSMKLTKIKKDIIIKSLEELVK